MTLIGPLFTQNGHLYKMAVFALLWVIIDYFALVGKVNVLSLVAFDW